jgi:hypothetical protein
MNCDNWLVEAKESFRESGYRSFGYYALKEVVKSEEQVHYVRQWWTNEGFDDLLFMKNITTCQTTQQITHTSQSLTVT